MAGVVFLARQTVRWHPSDSCVRRYVWVGGGGGERETGREGEGVKGREGVWVGGRQGGMEGGREGE